MAYALVTGSAKGIGKSIAIELAKKGYNLLLTDIDETNLIDTTKEISTRYNCAVSYLVKDLADADVAQSLLAWSEPFHNELEILANNAGYGATGYFEKLPIKDQLGIIDVNIKATIAITYAFLPVLHRRPKAHVMITGSTTAYQSVPYLAVYSGSKAFIHSFTRSLRYELRKSNINVSCLVPGPTDTHWVKRAGIGPHTLKTADIFNMTPDEVAKIGVKGLFKNKSEIVTGLSNKLNAFFPKFFPKRFVEGIGGRIYDPEKNVKQLK